MELANEKTNCYKCIHRRTIPGDCHTQCAKPDPDMTGDPHGIRNGWFMYPYNFDPIWKTKECVNFEERQRRMEGSDESVG